MFGSLARLISRHRGRLAQLALVLALLGVGREIWGAYPRDLDVELLLGPEHGQVVELRVAYVQDGEEVHGVKLHFPTGAPDRVRHRVSLPPGTFQLQAELRQRDGSVSAARRALQAPAEATVRIDLGAGS